MIEYLFLPFVVKNLLGDSKNEILFFVKFFLSKKLKKFVFEQKVCFGT